MTPVKWPRSQKWPLAVARAGNNIWYNGAAGPLFEGYHSS